MVTNLGNALPYIGGRGAIPVPSATEAVYRHAHPEQKPKPRGLNWDQLTPTCPGCQEKSGQIDGSGLCPGCRGDAPTAQPADVAGNANGSYVTLHEDDITRRFTAPTQTPQDETTSDVASEESVIDAPAFGRSNTRPASPSRPAAPTRPTVRAKVTRTSNHDLVIALRSTGDPLDPVAVSALLHDLLTALNTTQTPAASSTTPTAAGPTEARRRPVGKPARRASTPTRPRQTRSTFDTAKARSLYLDDGLTIPSIAEQLGCAKSTVRRHLLNDGVTLRDDRAGHSGGRNAKTTHDDDPHLRDEIIRRYNAGESTVQLGKALGHSPGHIGDVLRRAGIELRPAASAGRPITDHDRVQITTSYAGGESIAKIAARLSIKKDRVRDVLVDAGIDLRPRGGATEDRTGHHDPAAVRAWAHATGRLAAHVTHGRLPRVVVDAYAEAHPSTTSTPQGDTAA